jgi:hypothetical protein
MLNSKTQKKEDYETILHTQSSNAIDLSKENIENEEWGNLETSNI